MLKQWLINRRNLWPHMQKWGWRSPIKSIDKGVSQDKCLETEKTKKSTGNHSSSERKISVNENPLGL